MPLTVSFCGGETIPQNIWSRDYLLTWFELRLDFKEALSCKVGLALRVDVVMVAGVGRTNLGSDQGHGWKWQVTQTSSISREPPRQPGRLQRTGTCLSLGSHAGHMLVLKIKQLIGLFS